MDRQRGRKTWRKDTREELRQKFSTLQSYVDAWLNVSRSGRVDYIAASNAILYLREVREGLRADCGEAVVEMEGRGTDALDRLEEHRRRLEKILRGMRMVLDAVKGLADRLGGWEVSEERIFSTLGIRTFEEMAEDVVAVHTRDLVLKMGLIDAVMCEENHERKTLGVFASTWLTQPLVNERRMETIFAVVDAEAACADALGFVDEENVTSTPQTPKRTPQKTSVTDFLLGRTPKK